MMKAWVLKDIGNIELCDVDVPEPDKNEVLIRVEAAGICGSDIPRIYKTGAHRMPLIPGHEFSGVVEGIGKKVHPYWLKKEVAVFPKIACGQCPYCKAGHPENCTEYDYVGSRRDGAFAEYVTVPASNLLELPENVDFETAAMLEPMAVAANAVRKGCFREGSLLPKDRPVAVCGLGTIGLMTVMLLQEEGFQNIYAIGNKESQRAKAEAYGVPGDHFCNSRETDAAEWLGEASDGGVAVYFECVGTNESIAYGLKGTMPGGTLVLVGNPASDMTFSKDTWWGILRKQLTIRGIWNSTFSQNGPMEQEDVPDDWNYVLQKLSQGRLNPKMLITHRFFLEELEQGFHIMRDKSEDYTKVMMQGGGMR